MAVMLSAIPLRLVSQLAVHCRALPHATQLVAAAAAGWHSGPPRLLQSSPLSAAVRRPICCSCVTRRRQIRPRPPPAPAPPAAGPQRWDPVVLAAHIYRLLSAEERLLAVSEQSAAAVLELLRGLQFTEQQLTELLLSRPVLLRRGPAAWRAVVPLLLEHGCAAQQLLDILSGCPALLDRGRAELEAALSALLAGLPTGDAPLLELLHSQPQLLLLPAGQLRRQLTQLLTVFTSEQAARVVLRCPTVLLEHWPDTSRKLDYLLDTMGLMPAEVAHSSAMAWSLAHIRTRHTALERSGGYTRPRAKDTEPSGNPTPTEMLGHSDELFCQRVARLPYQEYEVFTRILQAEREEEAADSAESDSDDDLDDSTAGYHSKGRGGR